MKNERDLESKLKQKWFAEGRLYTLEGLSLFYTEKGRRRAIVKAIENKLISDPATCAYVMRAIQDYENAGDFRYAAEIANEIGSTKRYYTLDLETANKFYKRAMQNYEKAGDRANAIRKGDGRDKFFKYLYEESAYFLQAVELADIIGDVESKEKFTYRAATCLEMLTMYEEKAKLVGKEEAFERAMRKYHKEYNNACDFRDADELAEEIGLVKERGDVERANTLYDRAIQIYVEAGWFVEAATLAKDKGDVERAEVYEILTTIWSESK